MQRAQVGEHGENAAVAVLALGHTKLLQDMGAVGLGSAPGWGQSPIILCGALPPVPPKGCGKNRGSTA
jgi:hypothetical protein